MKYLYFLKRILCINHVVEIASLSFGTVRNDVTQIVILCIVKDDKIGYIHDRAEPVIVQKVFEISASSSTMFPNINKCPLLFFSSILIYRG
jgi:hypothetical protein